MKTRLIFKKLNHHLPPWASSLLLPYKIYQNTSSSYIQSTPKYCLNNGDISLNNGDISLLLSNCGREGNYRLGTSIHASIIKNLDFSEYNDPEILRISIVTWNSLLSMYCKCGKLFDADKLFDRMPVRDTISWNSMISGVLRNGRFESGIGLFNRMRKTGTVNFDKATLTTVLSACDGPEFCYVTKMIHCLVFVDGYVQEITVGNAMITSYFKCMCFSSAKQVFDEMFEKNVVTWTAIISGFVQNQFFEEGFSLFVKMRCGLVNPNSVTYLSALSACAGLHTLNEGKQVHAIVWKVGIESDLWIESTLMDLYSKCGAMKESWQIFESAKKLDAIFMTVMLVGFAQNGYEEEAVQFFLKIVNAGYEVDPNMVSAILGVFGADTSLSFGQQIHSLIIKKNFTLNPFVSNGLINMYSKCGVLEESTKIFNRMPEKNSISWNSMLAAFARHGDGLKALDMYEEMISQGVGPTDVTFLSLLHACSHVGLVEKGMKYLQSMTKIHNISPRMEHYACVVDMLGRAGLLSQAKTFIENLPEKPNLVIWQALLGACAIYGNSEMGEYASKQLFLEAPENPMSFILLANIYSSEGRWKKRGETIKKMREKGVSKETGISWIEIEKKVHTFVVEDRMHSQDEMIYRVLTELLGLMVDEGYVPDKRFILFKLDKDAKNPSLLL